MNTDNDDDDLIYRVVVNHEEQYSIWPSDRDLPLGWKPLEMTGRKADCLAYIELNWKDMRPLSLRKHMNQLDDRKAAGETAVADEGPASADASAGASLVASLASGKHPVELALLPEKTAATLKECIDRGFVRIRFVDTRGGTELGMKLNLAASVVRKTDLDIGKGTVHLEGDLTLDQTNVRCVVDLDVATLRGEGCLVPVKHTSR